MKFLIEILSLAIFFVLFRAGVRRFMPKKQEIQSLSEDSLKALQKFRLRYFALLFSLTLLATIVFRFALAWLQELWFSWVAQDYEMVFSLQDFNLWLPALLLGFLVSTILAFRLNRKMQKDGLSFFLEEIQEEAQGYESYGPKRWLQYGLGFLFFIFLVIPQFRDSLRFTDQGVYQYQNFAEPRYFERENFKVLDSSGEAPVILFEDSLSIDLVHYEYQEQDLRAYFK